MASPVFSQTPRAIRPEDYITNVEDLARRNRGGFTAVGQDAPTNLPYTPSSGFRAMGQMSPYGFPVNPVRPTNISQFKPLDREQFQDTTTEQIYGWGDLQTGIQNTGGSRQDQQQQPVQPTAQPQQPGLPQMQTPDEFGDLEDNDPFGGSQGQVLGAKANPYRKFDENIIGPKPIAGPKPMIGPQLEKPTDRMQYYGISDRAGELYDTLGASTDRMKELDRQEQEMYERSAPESIKAIRDRLESIQERRNAEARSERNRAGRPDPTLSPAPQATNIFDSLNPIKPAFGAEYGESIPANNPLEFDFGLPKAGEGIANLQNSMLGGSNIFRKGFEDIQPFKKIGEASATLAQGVDSVAKGVKGKAQTVAKAAEGTKNNVFNAINNVKNTSAPQNRSSQGGQAQSNNQPSRSVIQASSRPNTSGGGGRVTVSTPSVRPAPAGQAVGAAPKPQASAPKPAPKPAPVAAPKPNVFNQLISWLFKR